MERRAFFGAGLAAAAAAAKTHVVTLSFDDGFKESFERTAAIHEEFGLRACLNVIALGHMPGFAPMPRGMPDPMTPFAKGDFAMWNRLRERGHEVMPHTYDHQNLAAIPMEQAKELIEKCIEYFQEHMEGFRPEQSVYSFAYNASTPEIEAFALRRFLGIRTRGESAMNPLPRGRRATRIGCRSFGPGNCDAFLDGGLNRFLDGPGGWYVFNAHGLDEEGWGPMSAAYLRSLLRRLSRMANVAVLPAGEVLLRS